jgi:crotonobetainyl-CoA:carnitine CoA-transferase CaiB-like acyl-CoA transferase/citrate lyase beta subunit
MTRAALTSMLFVPGGDERKLAKVPELVAPALILDLEDAVAASIKEASRGPVAETVAEHGHAQRLWVRVNGSETGLLAGDVDAVVVPGLAGIVLPKVESAAEVRAVDGHIGLLERSRGLAPGSVELIATIETARGLAACEEIACAAARMHTLGFGAGDFSLDLGLEWPPPSGELSQTLIAAKCRLVLAARVAGLEAPHDGVYASLRDEAGLRREAEQARALGFTSKHAIHPAQVPVIDAVFAPAADELARAREIVEAFAASEREGKANIRVGGLFVDYPVAERARRVLARAAASTTAPAVAPTAVPAEPAQPPLPLAGLKVLDLASLYAAPLIATNLADFGAEVVKVEHPRGDDARRWGLSKDGVPLWWKSISRGKRVAALDLNDEQDRAIVRRLCDWADVVIENFRPGTMERWGLAPEELHRTNPRLVLVRVTGFGQTGPKSSEPGFGTLAEAFSGFAHITGAADGPPTLPPFGLADGITGLMGAFATMLALYWRDARHGTGQVVDLSLYEPLFSILGPQVIEYTQLGVVQNRLGNRSPRTSPRNAYRTADDRWVAVSGGTQQIVNRILAAIGRPELAHDPRFSDAAARRANSDAIDGIVAEWVAVRPLAEVLAAFQQAQAPIAPVYDAAQIVEDAHYRERGTLLTMPDDDLGEVQMPGIVPRLSRTPGRVSHTGPTAIGADTDAILAEVLGTVRPHPAADERGGARDPKTVED